MVSKPAAVRNLFSRSEDAILARRALFESLLEKFEYAFVFISLFLFTDAVLIVILSGGASEGDGFDYGSVNFAPVQLFYMLNYSLTLLFLVCRYKRTIYVLLSNPLMVATSVLIASSFFWSFSPDDSLTGGVFATCNMLFAVYLAGRFTLKQQLTILSYVLFSIAVLNILFVKGLPQYGVMGPPVHTGAWRGVFTHKNGAGRLMVLACGVMFTMFNDVKNIRFKWMYLIGLLLSLYMIKKTGSGGALVNSIFIMAIVLITQVFKTKPRKLLLSLIFMTSATICISMAYVPIMTFALGLIGKDPTFTGRTDIWEYVHTMIGKRPALGYGVGGFWNGTDGPSLYIIQRARWNVPDSHQGFLDLTLQIGFIGASMVCLVMWQTLLRGVARVRLFKSWVSSWPTVYVLYLSLVNLSESSLLAPNSIFWILVCTTSFTTSFEAKYLVDFDRFGLVGKNKPRADQIMGKVKPPVNAHTNI
ncbi:O-antigen ligase family protein [Leptolyngbya cf. ectocarpi LEGE 11479]|uniref:O-antigen ligase family protein n=1 Tax=Leptolyngbya cf. ectocarpi LEGE 11479 TaxID=1828722 RepID=A0A928ZY78_LEPEC|nr:O-antigen ligase family protein [Leptolyngbya ectocarpi]MBE9069692.1 O-antigen ligase family protein [Leptolyngbya cf. ectocarpi LEGE 11479]